MRARRTGPLVKMIKEAHAKYGKVSMLDVGGRKTYWNILPQGFLQSHNVTVTVLNLPGELTGTDDDTFKHIAGDACNLVEYGDKAFHIAHSNSVIEHVGGWTNVKKFAAEVRRVASGLFVQTPYFWFPIEPHYVAPLLHWTPRPIQESLILNFAIGHKKRKAANLDAAIAEVDGIPRLLDLRTYRLLFPDCVIVKEKYFLLTKSMVAVRPLQ
ncbi:MAG: hypothetical protein JWM32_570 [Verrucomicrobia bacterium]|nr:hypothetical protein [Verrucomicrobiota bacterium]